MFAFNDSWQATNPLYIKITYTTPGFWPGLSLIVEMGSQQNNSGSITSVDRIVTTAETVSNQGNLLPYTDRIQGSGDGSYISLLMFTNTSTRQYAGQVLLCERWYDRFGQPTGSGFHLVNTGLAISTRLTQQASKYGELALPASELYSVVNSRPSRAPAVYNGNLILGLIYPFYDTTLNPTPNLLLGESTTFSTAYSTVEYTVYGTRNTYVNAGGAVFDSRQTVYSNGRWLVRYV
jgi:hypothetical protein